MAELALSFHSHLRSEEGHVSHSAASVWGFRASFGQQDAAGRHAHGDRNTLFPLKEKSVNDAISEDPPMLSEYVCV